MVVNVVHLGALRLVIGTTTALAAPNDAVQRRRAGVVERATA
jgi:hypothetical protein